ncbi:MAG: autotransporter outer membrane beta-barrel domain-containing protein [Verrucomicrobiales bacterium]|jgi:outer membrane autotransporter protein|nr:autotransporter outer membrane beta-barrel domain-containing protein [Verrucomicrobiales bacterium]
MNPKLTLLTLCALSASALNVFAENKVVTSGTVTEADKTYEAVSNQAALQVSGSDTVYSGTNIIASSTFGGERSSLYVTDHATVSVFGGTFTYAAAPQGYTVLATGSALLRMENVVINGTPCYAGMLLRNADTTIISSTIHAVTKGSYYFGTGIDAEDGVTTLADVTVEADFAGLIGRSDWILNSVTVTATNGSDTYGALVMEGTVSGSNVHAVSSGIGYVQANPVNAQFTDSSITTTGTQPVLRLGARNAADVSLTFTGGTLAGTEGQDLLRVFEGNGSINVTLNEVDTAAAGGISQNSRDGFTGTAAMTLNGGSGLRGAVAHSGGSELRLNLNDSSLTGNTTNTDEGRLTITATNSVLTGDITGSGNSITTINLNAGTLTGTASGQDAAVINITVTSPGGAYAGDITQTGDASVTLTLDYGATGEGGFTGGTLITSEDSKWTFNQDSHGHYGENNGTWNIGDYDVTFDNLTHTGTVTINVNSDTGEGGSLTVGTADGDGTVHIDTTGEGKLNPNDVLPDKVTGKGTENWQWDPINWGLDTVIKDGDHFIKQRTSPAGAVLNSAIAVQQSLWFAQQNSLLKRMGDLRYGARASRPLAGETPAFHIIENIWLRSYGQQLNIGSQVAGQAYEQRIYGVDIGTDHKFTLSADSDLYLGVYAGYGRSDLDYRTPGADGELNSYYGGLYATWLHSSGFYIDATFKAASIDNNLKAPYGSTQLTANYSDVNLGGSLEIGKKFTFADDWFIEPQFQVNYLHILAENYQAGPMSITASDLDALQLRLGSLFGRTLKLANGGALQPYVKISGVETISSGGTLHNGYQSTRANTDGARAELGGGIIWQLDTNNQLHLDYEASFGDKYDKPWGLTAGYRHQF